MSDLLQLPIDTDVRLDNASYKNPARIVIRSRKNRSGWKVYYCMADGRHWLLDTIKPTANGTAIVFDAHHGPNAKHGVNQRLAEVAGDISAREIHDAASFYVFAVSPNGNRRTRVHEFHNDKYVPKSGDSGPPWELSGWGSPRKVAGERGIFRQLMDVPPDYEPRPPGDPEDPDEPERPAGGWIDEPDVEPDLPDVVLAERFEDWHEYPATLDVTFTEVSRDDRRIEARWQPHLGALPRFEEGGRFGRLCWTAWDGRAGLWVGGHGEHLRIKQGEADEGDGAGIHPFGDIGLDLGHTLARKSKLDDVDAIELDRLKRIGLFIVTHDNNPDPQRTAIRWVGEAFATETPGEESTAEPTDDAATQPEDDSIAAPEEDVAPETEDDPSDEEGHDGEGDDVDSGADDRGEPPVDDPSAEHDCSREVRAARAADAEALDALEKRLRDEVVDPFKELGTLDKITQAPGLLRKAEEIIEQDYRPLLEDMRGTTG